MPRELYNEGRVVGYSAYEVYVRHAMSVDPDTQPASELEWLSSSIATGSSMLVQIPAEYGSESGHHFIDIKFPSNTKLAAANTILGSFFLGTAVFNGNWAAKVTSYGPLLTNSTIYPSTSEPHTSDYVEYPHTVSTPLSQAQQSQLREYVKVIDAIIIQPGRWKDATNTPPFKDFEPDLSDVPTLRIFLADKIRAPFNILLTGFTLRTVLDGVSGLDGSTDTSTNEYQDGGFLGPAVYPWANKVVFSVPPALINYAVKLNADYTRTIDGSTESVDSASTIDMEATDPSSYYTTNYTTTPVSYTVTNTNIDNAVLTVYQRSSVLPPALYGTKVTRAGNSKLYPLDTVAPGTTKIFEGSNSQSEATATNQIPGNIGMYRDSDYVIHQTIPAGPNDSTDPISDSYVVELPADRLGGQRPYGAENISGKKSVISISLQDTAGQVLPRTGIHPPEFDNSLVFELQVNRIVQVTTEPSDWETGYSSYYWYSGHNWYGDGTTTVFTITGFNVPDSLKGVSVDGYSKAEGTDWTYSNGTLTFTTAPANGVEILTFVTPPATFETMNPISSTGDEQFIKRKGTLHWDDLLFALANNKAIDLFDNDYFKAVFYDNLISKLNIKDGLGYTLHNIGSPEGYMDIYANLRAGLGINLSPADNHGTITITNTLPDFTHGKYTIATVYDDFRFNAVNNFVGYRDRIQTNDELNGDTSLNRGSGRYKYRCTLSYMKAPDNSVVYIKVSAASSYGTYNCTLGSDSFLFPAYGNADGNMFGPASTADHAILTTVNGPINQEVIGDSVSKDCFAFLHTNHSSVYRKKSNILNIKFTDTFIETLFGSCYTLTTQEPDDWSQVVVSPNQVIYFYFELLNSQPSDWTTNYYNYFTKVDNTYKPISSNSVPTWEQYKYYRRIRPTSLSWEDDKYYIDTRLLYEFVDTSSLAGGIWNVEPKKETRASWNAHCGLRGNASKYQGDSEQGVWGNSDFAIGMGRTDGPWDNTLDFKNLNIDSIYDIGICGFSYADGYNQQIPYNYNSLSTHQDGTCDSKQLNINTSGIFRKIIEP